MSQSTLNYEYVILGYYPILPICTLTESKCWSLDSRSMSNKIYRLVYSSKSAAMTPIDVNKNIFDLLLVQ
jgi:hypothetical protein